MMPVQTDHLVRDYAAKSIAIYFFNRQAHPGDFAL